jgi:parallel beta helix pectate lyase-like protein
VDVKIKAIVVAGVLAATMLGGSGPATAAPPAVSCGSVLETDAYLTHDLRCPAGNGIFLEIDVTLDLRGHRLIGPGATAQGSGSGIAVTLSPAWPSKVINGTIKDWPVAIGGNEDFETSETATLEDLTLVGNGTAVLANQANLTINRSTFRRNATGINARSWGELGTRLSVTGSTFRDNDVAVQVDPRTTATLRDNVFRGNGVGYTVTAGDLDGYNALLERNTFTANGDAVHVTAPGTSLGENTALRNSGWGIYAPGAIDLGGNVARRNGNNPQCVGVAC